MSIRQLLKYQELSTDSWHFKMKSNGELNSKLKEKNKATSRTYKHTPPLFTIYVK